MVSIPRFHKEELQQEQEPGASAPFEAGDLIVSYLEQLGVEYVFGIPGGPIEPLYNALARSARRGGPRPIVARHESGAAFMADGYARESGKLGVCCATTGPGTTNMLTGIASAYQDNTPMLVITAQSPLPTFGRGAAQESSCDGVNTVEILRYCTRYSSMVSHIDQLEWKLASALNSAWQWPRGPAHLSIPLDLLRMRVESSRPSYDIAKLLRTVPFCDMEGLSQLHELLAAARKTVLLIGERAADAVDVILDYAAISGATVVTSPQAKGLVNAYHQNYRGVFGLAGHTSAACAITDPSVDLIVALGSRLDELATNGWDESSLMTEKLVHVDMHPEFFSRAPMSNLHVCGDIREIMLSAYDTALQRRTRPIKISESSHSNDDNVVKFERRQADRRRLLKNTEQSTRSRPYDMERRGGDRRKSLDRGYGALRYFRCNDEYKCLDQSAPIKPQRLMFDLSRLLPPSTRFVADIGNSFLWAIHYLHPYNRTAADCRPEPHNFLYTGMGFSSMGWAIGAAVGIAMAHREAPVVCITGDGSFLMSGQEITTSLMEQLRVIFVVLNDASLGTVRHGQTLAGAELIGHQLPQVSYASIANAMGIEAFTVASPSDLARIDFLELAQRRSPCLLDIHIDANEPPPLGERLEMLASGK